MKQLTIILIIIAVLGLGATGYFFYQNRGLEEEIVTLKDGKAEVEKELAVLKNTDLAKENNSLKSQLTSKEETLAAERRNLTEAELRLKTAEAKIQHLEMNIEKTKPHVNVLKAFNDWQFSVSPFPLVDRDTRSVDNAISALGDSQVSNLWREVKAGFPAAKQTGNLRYEEVIILITSKLTSLLR